MVTSAACILGCEAEASLFGAQNLPILVPALTVGRAVDEVLRLRPMSCIL